jgi:hypothetical protein
MSDLETRLAQAADETRRAAGHATPPPLLSPRSTRARGWLVLATAFAAVIAVFAIVPLLVGPQAEPAGTVPSPTTTGEAPTSTGPENPVVCSSSGLPQPELDPDLPAAVAAKAHAIIRFSSSCDFDGLAGLATPGFVTSFGGGGIENLRQWEEEGHGELGTLLQLFGTSPAVLEGEHDPKIYVWPAALVYESWADIPEELRLELLMIYTEEELDQIAGFGSYAGWRTGIDELGNWLYFVAGD